MTASQQAPQASTPIDEERRMDAVRQLNILDTPAEERFDRIPRLARRLFQVPMATLGLVDSTREWFKASIGMQHEQVGRRVSFAAHIVAEEGEIVVPDTRNDPRFARNLLVVDEPYIRFFAGHPLRSRDGSVVGAICLYDVRSRGFDGDDLATLRDLAAITDAELNVSRLTPALRELMARARATGEARIDPMTRLWNRAAVLEIVDREIGYAREVVRPLSLLIVDVDGLKAVNDRYGTPRGDEALTEIARRLRSVLRPYDSIGRYGGEEFLILLPDAAPEAAWSAGERLRAEMAERAVLPGVPLTISVGIASLSGDMTRAGDLVRKAERGLLEVKKTGGNRVYVQG
jgi:diguanylate cyclase (GGDEF)-like protein